MYGVGAYSRSSHEGVDATRLERAVLLERCIDFCLLWCSIGDHSGMQSMRRGRRRQRRFFSQRNAGALLLLLLLVLVLSMFYLRALRGGSTAQHPPSPKLSQQAVQATRRRAREAQQALRDSAQAAAHHAEQVGTQQVQQVEQIASNIAGQDNAQANHGNGQGQQLPPGVRAPNVQAENAQAQAQAQQGTQPPPRVHAPLHRPGAQQHGA